MGMSGTCSIAISVPASVWARSWGRSNVPSVAYTSIMGMAVCSYLLVVSVLWSWADVLLEFCFLSFMTIQILRVLLLPDVQSARQRVDCPDSGAGLASP